MSRDPWRTVPAAAQDDPLALAEHLDIEVWLPGAERSSPRRHAGRIVRESLRGRLPVRYATDSWRVPFDRLLAESLRPGIRILDVGAGSLPVVPVEDRPPGVEYVGLDVEEDELLKAPPGSYDDHRVADITVLQPDLVGQFDLVLSWLTMEHVENVPLALHNLGRYQRPGGRFLGYLAGSWSIGSVLNRVVPHSAAKLLMHRLLGRQPETVFRAHYDHCTYDELTTVGETAWGRATVVPVFTAGWYFSFSPALRAAYLLYEEWAASGAHPNLASYYILDAVAAEDPDDPPASGRA
ncbi:bifunctional 2-polyprenyl-6-hydroxyphenol methylase/3-demethylubiquinol 3-O-methyltransferase UbiG [Patulibacter sp.]|uniref:class I SAM-dependent methyltransferase n=1 Tax=Patulibacter sp. TaxID=1912859 RepID=UPI002725137C|nr:class I SAM-dependent methyltransferase [Patulibacter sp.]MDO9407674.1 class I SAM-dependent methyltransferase [Patulibacter sp.]